MSSSGLIYAVIVGAWAAYLVPMWLRRQDELNEARPTERFSTAIRLLSGRAAMERRVARARGENVEPDADAPDDDADPDEPDVSVDVRGLAVPATEVRRPVARSAPQAGPAAGPGGGKDKRAQLLARRRRITTSLFLAFTAGAIAAAVGGVELLWVPAIPAVLLTVYIGQMRRQERRRYEVRLDQRRAAEAARRLRAPRPAAQVTDRGLESDERPVPAPKAARPAPPPAPAPAPSPRSADRRALVEQTDHAEWVDQQRAQQSGEDGWAPVPVPLPTYVTAPVAPRTSEGVDLGAPGTWSSARSGTTPGDAAAAREPHERREGQQPKGTAEPRPQQPPARRPRSSRTPLFDQYADPDRPRAANE
ncbi:divisome protein SepX/GlpR [Actinacidiphila sp. bgisy145]|uniref:divisome protein SepX/GlpR n=1 Tax=Actinacidiphila sp. bgisy145 TaxID=3413792 RepID=UPI003EBDB4D2